jgi:hypothetical protein
MLLDLVPGLCMSRSEKKYGKKYWGRIYDFIVRGRVGDKL